MVLKKMCATLVSIRICKHKKSKNKKSDNEFLNGRDDWYDFVYSGNLILEVACMELSKETE